MYHNAQVQLVWKPNKGQTKQSSIKLRAYYGADYRIYATRSKELLTREEFDNSHLKKTKEAYSIANKDLEIATSICEELGRSFTFTQFKILYDKRVNGKIAKGDCLSFDDLIIAYQTQKQCKPNTLESYRTAVNWIRSYNPRLTIADMTPEIICKVCEYIRKQHMLKYKKEISLNTMGMYMRGLRALFNYAIELGLIKNKPLQGVKITREERQKRALKEYEWKKFFKYSPTSTKTEFAHDFAILTMAMCGANMADILSLKNRSIVGSNIHFIRTKTEKVDTNVAMPLTQNAKSLLQKYGVINPDKPDAYILPYYTKGMTISQQDNKRNDILKRINNGIKIICKEIGIEPFTTYNLRHTFAVTASQSDNIGVVDIMNMLGHKNITTTQIYLQSVTESSQTKAREVISRLFEESEQ